MNDALHQQDFWTPHALELWESFGQMPWGSNWNLTSCCQRSAGKSPLQLSYIEMNYKQESNIHISGIQINDKTFLLNHHPPAAAAAAEEEEEEEEEEKT